MKGGREGCFVIATVLVIAACGDAGEGEACGDSAGGRSIACKSGLVCNYVMRPAACTKPIAQGELCLNEACAEGLVCNGALAPPACVPPGEAGKPCATNEDCRHELACRGFAEEDKKCGDYVPEEGACWRTGECAAGLVCERAQGIGVCRRE
jgi:hypothetical protein